MFHMREVEGYGTAHPLCLEVYPIANYGTVVHPFPPSGTREHRACRRGEVHSILAKHQGCMTALSPVFASLDGQEQGLVNSKVAPCAAKDFGHRVWCNDFEAVAKRA